MPRQKAGAASLTKVRRPAAPSQSVTRDIGSSHSSADPGRNPVPASTERGFREREPRLSLSDLPVLLIWGGAIAIVLYALCAATWVVAP
jgi:hypothetical protein